MDVLKLVLHIFKANTAQYMGVLKLVLHSMMGDLKLVLYSIWMF